MAKEKAKDVKAKSVDAAQEVKVLVKEKTADVKAKSADAAHDVNELVKAKSAECGKRFRSYP